jgi:hypothetical protein
VKKQVVQSAVAHNIQTCQDNAEQSLLDSPSFAKNPQHFENPSYFSSLNQAQGKNSSNSPQNSLNLPLHAKNTLRRSLLIKKPVEPNPENYQKVDDVLANQPRHRHISLKAGNNQLSETGALTSDYVTLNSFTNAYKQLSNRRVFLSILIRYSSSKHSNSWNDESILPMTMSAGDLQFFLESEQNVDSISIEDCEGLINTFEPVKNLSILGLIGIDGFTRLMLDAGWTSLFNPVHAPSKINREIQNLPQKMEKLPKTSDFPDFSEKFDSSLCLNNNGTIDNINQEKFLNYESTPYLSSADQLLHRKIITQPKTLKSSY